MVNVPDSISLKQLCKKAAEALVRAGLDRRIDIYRDVEIDRSGRPPHAGPAAPGAGAGEDHASSLLSDAREEPPARVEAGDASATELPAGSLAVDLHEPDAVR